MSIRPLLGSDKRRCVSQQDLRLSSISRTKAWYGSLSRRPQSQLAIVNLGRRRMETIGQSHWKIGCLLFIPAGTSRVASAPSSSFISPRTSSRPPPSARWPKMPTADHTSGLASPTCTRALGGRRNGLRKPAGPLSCLFEARVPLALPAEGLSSQPRSPPIEVNRESSPRAHFAADLSMDGRSC